MKRVTLRVDEQDLAVIREIAARSGTSEAEIIRRGVHLAALASRRWTEPPDMPTFDSGDPLFAHRANRPR